MSGWITSYFFLELTFNGLSAAPPATTDSFYILPLEAGQGNDRRNGEAEGEGGRGEGKGKGARPMRPQCRRRRRRSSSIDR